jgi:hypothetical protein
VNVIIEAGEGKPLVGLDLFFFFPPFHSFLSVQF